MSDVKLATFENFSFENYKIPIIVVYHNTIDYPNKFIARLFNIDIPTKYVIISESIDEIREKLPKGLIRFGKEVNEDENVVETWL